MKSGRCYECVYAGSSLMRLLQAFSPGFGATLVCVNSTRAPGRMTDVLPSGTCRNFRPRPQPPVRTEPPQPPNDQVRYIALTRGHFATVDAADYEWLNKYRWCASKHAGGKVYARRFTTKGTVWMHREIMQPPLGMVVDHISGNSLDNRRSNMRNCEPHQNAYNKPPRGRKSKFKGVYPHGDKWAARIKHKGETYNLGIFADEIEAALARDAKARELEGEYAYINIPACGEPEALQIDDCGLQIENHGQANDGKINNPKSQIRNPKAPATESPSPNSPASPTKSRSPNAGPRESAKRESNRIDHSP